MSEGAERRKTKRMDLDIRVEMTRADGENAKLIPVEILDISRAGIGFFCQEELVNGAIYRADIRIWTGDTISAFINLVRVSKQENGNIYGGVFIGMPESDWCRIGVYETYREYDIHNDRINKENKEN
ncbi:PilZ domain-containing protein [Lachnospiraceae bacterium C1.1]|nr:PilZ domain-containing protein [Lachnospiraceae bacterium C1.1]